MKRYFVSYSHIHKHGYGFGCAEIFRRKKIKTMNDIQEIIETIEKNSKGKSYPIENVVVLNYKRMWF